MVSLPVPLQARFKPFPDLVGQPLRLQYLHRSTGGHDALLELQVGVHIQLNAHLFIVVNQNLLRKVPGEALCNSEYLRNRAGAFLSPQGAVRIV